MTDRQLRAQEKTTIADIYRQIWELIRDIEKAALKNRVGSAGFERRSQALFHLRNACDELTKACYKIHV
jgi:hypothetical protein